MPKTFRKTASVLSYFRSEFGLWLAVINAILGSAARMEANCSTVWPAMRAASEIMSVEENLTDSLKALCYNRREGYCCSGLLCFHSP